VPPTQSQGAKIDGIENLEGAVARLRREVATAEADAKHIGGHGFLQIRSGCLSYSLNS
jgi:hypothetical protein